MFKKLFQRNQKPSDTPPPAQAKAGKAAKGAKLKGDVGQQYEELKRKGAPIPPQLSAARGDMLRDLNNVPEAISLYEEAAVGYAEDEMWDHVDALVKKVERLAQGATAETRLLTLQLYLGRQDYPAARRLLQDLSSSLLPSDGIRIERMIHAVDSDTLADSDVEVALAETLIALARPDRALERLQRARIRAQREGKPERVSKIDLKIAQFSPDVVRQPLAASPPSAPVAAAAPASESRKVEALPTPVVEPEKEDDFFFMPAPATPAPAAAPTPLGSIPSAPLASERVERRLAPLAKEPAPAPDPAPAPREALKPSPEGGFTLPELPGLPGWPSLGETSLPLPPLGGDWPSLLGTEEKPQPEELSAAALPPAVEEVMEEAQGSEEAERSREGYLDPAQLIPDEEGYGSGTRFVGEDPTQGSQSEEEQVQQLVRKLREGIRAVVPENEANSHYQMGLNFMTMELWDEAVESLQTAFRAPAYRRIAAEALAESFLERGDAVFARGAIRLALESASDETPALGLWYWQGRAAEALQQPDEARQSYEQIAVFDTRFRDVMDRLRALA